MSNRTKATAAAIGVPVRNEVERLPRLFQALARQCNAPSFTLCLFFDNCTDGSVELAARLAPDLPFALVSESGADAQGPNAGKARARAMALAMHTTPAGIVLATDADSVPDANWVAANIDALMKADIVAGQITRDACAATDLQQRVSNYFDRLHRLRRRIDPIPWEDSRTHHWTSGASLGFRASVYAALGGFSDLPNGEDSALIDAAMRAGYRVRRDARVTVHTSSRREGRARLGLATALAHFDATAEAPDVSHPDDEVWRFRRQAEARSCYDRADLRPLISALSLDEAELRRAALGSANSEAFAAKVVGTPPSGMRLISLPHAEALLGARDPTTLAGAA
ncbi:MAG: glycosyltransferase [Tsuneonella sp.]